MLYFILSQPSIQKIGKFLPVEQIHQLVQIFSREKEKWK